MNTFPTSMSTILLLALWSFIPSLVSLSFAYGDDLYDSTRDPYAPSYSNPSSRDQYDGSTHVNPPLARDQYIAPKYGPASTIAPSPQLRTGTATPQGLWCLWQGWSNGVQEHELRGRLPITARNVRNYLSGDIEVACCFVPPVVGVTLYSDHGWVQTRSDDSE